MDRIAGTHTTSATTTLLFYHLFHNPELMREVEHEITGNLNPLSGAKPAFSITEIDASLPLLKKCMRENFRITPVFTMPLARRVTAPEGIVIADQHIPQGVSVTPSSSLSFLQTQTK